jgi:histidinol-phosphate aminotransferase
MPSFEDLSRKCIRKFSPYIPGKPIEEIKERFGLKDVFKLASNENPLGPSPKAREAIASCLAEIHRYPEGGSTRLRSALAKKVGVDAKCVIVGSGSDELIEILAKAFLEGKDNIVASEHAFIRYKMAGELMGIRVIEVPMTGFRHDLEAMARAVTPRTKIIFIANPNNPTGTYVSRDAFSRFIEGVSADKLVVIDEAYFEYARGYADYPDSLEFQKAGRKNIITLRTFSKIYGLAGLRTGYGIADPSVIAQMDRIRPPFNVTIPSQVACEAALEDTRHVEASVALNREVRSWLCEELDKKKVEYVPSAGNFVLVRTAQPAAQVFDALLQRGIIVRPMAEYGFPNHLRVTIGTKAEMELFLAQFLALEKKA